MLTHPTLERISALGLDPMTETAVIEIVEDAAAEAISELTQDGVLLLQIPGDWPADYQAQFWARYPNKKAKAAALKALDKIAHCGKTRWADLMAGLERYLVCSDVRRGYVKHPATWLNAQCWTDEDGPKPKANLNFFEIAARMMRE